MSTQAPARLASEEVIISAPLSYAGSAQRIIRIRGRAASQQQAAAMTALAVMLIVGAWIFITGWYLFWGILLVPYRLVRRGSRKRKVEALRHRELLSTIQGATLGASPGSAGAPNGRAPTELVADVDREHAVQELRQHLLSGRLTTEEFEERLASAHMARTQADLDSVRTGLPSAG